MIITPTYNQLDKLKRLRPLIKGDWLLAIDGDEETKKWAQKKGIEYVYQERNGRQYNRICNMAAQRADGYMLFINGDSFPDVGYYEAMEEAKAPNRIVCGVRMNVDEGMKVISPDHRLKWYPGLSGKPFKLEGKEPWTKQTSNGMLVHKEVWDKLKGFDEIYEGYGVVDQDFCMRAHYEGYENWWAPKAILSHMDTENKKDNPNNYKIYEERKAGYST